VYPDEDNTLQCQRGMINVGRINPKVPRFLFASLSIIRQIREDYCRLWRRNDWDTVERYGATIRRPLTELLPSVADKSTPCTGRKPVSWVTATRSVTRRIFHQPPTSWWRVAGSSLCALRKMARRQPGEVPCRGLRRPSTSNRRSPILPR